MEADGSRLVRLSLPAFTNGDYLQAAMTIYALYIFDRSVGSSLAARS